MTDAVTTGKTDWRTLLLADLLNKILPSDRNEVRRIARCAKTYVVIDDELYKCS